jgi:hypothetical protein
LASIKQRNWQGKDLPFPVLLNGRKKTHDALRDSQLGEGVLIDLNGKLIAEAHISELEAKPPPLPAAKNWARHRDMRKNVDWSFEPIEYSVSRFADMIKRWAGCDITVDVGAVKACGLTEEGPLPNWKRAQFEIICHEKS